MLCNSSALAKEFEEHLEIDKYRPKLLIYDSSYDILIPLTQNIPFDVHQRDFLEVQPIEKAKYESTDKSGLHSTKSLY